MVKPNLNPNTPEEMEYTGGGDPFLVEIPETQMVDKLKKKIKADQKSG